jgi:hypothetical protein
VKPRCGTRGGMLRTPDLPIPPIRRSFPKPLSSVPLFGYNPHRHQASSAVQSVVPGQLASVFVGLFCERPAG